MNLINDIYYLDSYISLYLKEDEELFNFEYKEDNNVFINKTIKRPILNIGNIKINDGFYDLETAYGYGGFYTNSDDKLFLKNAMQKYEIKCKEEKIIAEFIRFHPFNTFSQNHNSFLDINLYDRDVVVKDLTQDIFKSYPSKVRNTVKRSREKVTINESENIKKFVELYNATMLKNGAGDFYFFDDKYYEKLLQDNSNKLYEVTYQDEIVAMGFFMYGNDICHYHLSANTDISYSLNSNYALLDYVFNIAKEKGLKYFLLGGGTTTDEYDSLFKFKKKFSKELKPFYISGKIYNNEVYDKYNNLWIEQSKKEIKYFLKYRLEIK